MREEGSFSRDNTNSPIDTRGGSFIAGLSRYKRGSSGRHLTVGGFFEDGNGSCDTFNALSTGIVRGDGDTQHDGGGVLGRIDFTQGGHWYADGSVRAGGLHKDDGTFDLRSMPGHKATQATYASDSAYLGTHFGIGKRMSIGNSGSLDLYGQDFWTHQQGDRVTLPTREEVDFADVNSHRLRFGGRLSGVARRTLCPYIGAAWE